MNDIIINNNGDGDVVIKKHPTNLPPKQKHFKRMLKIGKLRFYVTWDYRLKNSQMRDRKNSNTGLSVYLKEKLYKKHGKKCEACGKELQFRQAQIHHVLPWRLFREYEHDERNLMCLCQECHRRIHLNPFLDCELQRKKAEELKINLKDYYGV